MGMDPTGKAMTDNVQTPTQAQIRAFINASDEDMENLNDWDAILEVVGNWFCQVSVDLNHHEVRFHPVAEQVEAYLNPVMGADENETLFDSVDHLYTELCDFLVFASEKQKEDILNIMLPFAASK